MSCRLSHEDLQDTLLEAYKNNFEKYKHLSSVIKDVLSLGLAEEAKVHAIWFYSGFIHSSATKIEKLQTPEWKNGKYLEVHNYLRPYLVGNLTFDYDTLISNIEGILKRPLDVEVKDVETTLLEDITDITSIAPDQLASSVESIIKTIKDNTNVLDPVIIDAANTKSVMLLKKLQTALSAVSGPLKVTLLNRINQEIMKFSTQTETNEQGYVDLPNMEEIGIYKGEPMYIQENKDGSFHEVIRDKAKDEYQYFNPGQVNHLTAVQDADVLQRSKIYDRNQNTQIDTATGRTRINGSEIFAGWSVGEKFNQGKKRGNLGAYNKNTTYKESERVDKSIQKQVAAKSAKGRNFKNSVEITADTAIVDFYAKRLGRINEKLGNKPVPFEVTEKPQHGIFIQSNTSYKDFVAFVVPSTGFKVKLSTPEGDLSFLMDSIADMAIVSKDGTRTKVDFENPTHRQILKNNLQVRRYGNEPFEKGKFSTKYFAISDEQLDQLIEQGKLYKKFESEVLERLASGDKNIKDIFLKYYDVNNVITSVNYTNEVELDGDLAELIDTYDGRLDVTIKDAQGNEDISTQVPLVITKNKNGIWDIQDPLNQGEKIIGKDGKEYSSFKIFFEENYPELDVQKYGSKYPTRNALYLSLEKTPEGYTVKSVPLAFKNYISSNEDLVGLAATMSFTAAKGAIKEGNTFVQNFNNNFWGFDVIDRNIYPEFKIIKDTNGVKSFGITFQMLPPLPGVAITTEQKNAFNKYSKEKLTIPIDDKLLKNFFDTTKQIFKEAGIEMPTDATLQEISTLAGQAFKKANKPELLNKLQEDYKLLQEDIRSKFNTTMAKADPSIVSSRLANNSIFTSADGPLKLQKRIGKINTYNVINDFNVVKTDIDSTIVVTPKNFDGRIKLIEKSQRVENALNNETTAVNPVTVVVPEEDVQNPFVKPDENKKPPIPPINLDDFDVNADDKNFSVIQSLEGIMLATPEESAAEIKAMQEFLPDFLNFKSEEFKDINVDGIALGYVKGLTAHINATINAKGVPFHEGFHLFFNNLLDTPQKTYYLQKMNKATGGFKTDSKGRYLMFNGEKKYYDEFVKERRYFHLSENQIKNLMHEEFMADGWADFISTHKAPRTWLEKLFRFLEKIFNMFTAKGRIRNLYFDIAAGKFKTARLQDTKGNDEPVYSIYRGVPTLKLKNPLNPSDLTPKLDSTNVIPSHISNQVSNLVLAEMVKLKNVNKGLKANQLFDMAVDTVAKDFDIDAIVETNKGNEAKIREVLESDFTAAQWLLGQFHLKNKSFKVANLSGIESFNNQVLSSKNSSQINLSVANHELFKNDVLKEFQNIETIEDIPSEFESSVDDAELDELEKDSYKDSGSYITAKPDEGDGAFRQMFKYITYEYIHPTLGIKLKRTVDPKNIFNTIRKVTANCLTKDQVVPKLKSEIDRLSANVKNFYDNIQPTLDSNIIPESDAKTINLRDSLKAVYDTLDDICKFNDNQIPTRNEHVFNQFAKVFNLIDASLIQINLYSLIDRDSKTGTYSPKKQTFRTSDIVVGTDLNSVRLNFLERIRLLSVSEETAKNATAKLSEIETIFKDENVIRDKFISNGVLNEAVFQKYINDIYSTLANLNLGIPRDVVEMVLLKDIWNSVLDVNVFPLGTNARTLLKNNKELLDYKLSNIDYEFFSASIPYLIKIGNNAGNSQNEVLVNFKKIFVTTYVNGVGEYLLKYDSSLASSVTRNANGDLVQKYVRPTPAHIAVLKLHSEDNIVNGLQKVINEDHNGFQSFFADNPLLNTNDVRNATFLNALEVNSFAGFKQTQNSDFGLSNTRDASTFKDIDDTAYLLSMMGLFANRNILTTLDGTGNIKTFKRILTQFEATSTSIVIDGLLDNYTDVNGSTSLRENGTSKIASTLLKLVNQEYNLIKKNFQEHANNSAAQQWESYNVNPEKDRGYKFNHLSDFFAMNTSEDLTSDSERATNLKIRRGLSEKLIENASQGKSLKDFIKENPEDADSLKTQLDKYAEEQYARFDNRLRELNIKDVDLPTNEIVPGKQEAETFKPTKLKREFFYNTWVNTLFVNQMFEGSMAANVGTFAEYFKRNKSGAAAGSNISVANAKTKTYRAAVVGKIKFWINDNLQGSMLVEPPRDSQGNPLPGWKQVDAFDGQSINTINRRMRIADSQGSLTPELEESLHKMRFMTHSNAEYSKTIQKLRDAGIIFNSLKTVTAAPMVYLKQSEHTLIRKDVSILKADKQANRDQAYADLDILWRKIDYYTSQIENGVEGYNDKETNEYVSYEKLYKDTIQSIHSFYEPIPGRTALHNILDSMEFHRIEQFLDKNGSKKATPRTINLDLQAIAAGLQAYVKLDESLVDVPNAYTFIQVETGGLSRSITDGIQKKLLIMTQLDANSPEYAAIEKEIKAYDANLTELVKNESETINRLLRSNAGGVVGAIYSKIADGLRKQGNSSMLKWFELDAEGKPVYDPSVPGVGKAVEFYLFSYFNTNLFDKKVAGEKYYHVSPFGYEIMEVSDKKGNKKIITQDEYKKNPSRYKNVTTRYPSVIKEEVTDPLTGEKIDRYVVEVIIPKELQAVDQELVERYLAEKWKDTFFATRTPTEGKRSMMVCKVVDFIDEAYGNSIIVPFQMHMLSGSDFDIDSLYAYKYSTYRGLDGQKIIYGDYRVYEQDYGMTTDEAKFMEYLLHMSKDPIVEDLVNNELDRINEQTSADKTMLLKRAAYIFGGGVKNYLLNAVKEVVKGGEGYNTASRLLATLNVLTKLKDAGLPTTVSELKNASYNPVSNVLYNKVLDNKIRILQDPAVFTKFMVNPNERADVAIEVYKEAVTLKGVTESEVYNRQNYATPTALVISRSFNSEFKDALSISASFNKGISLLETVNAILSEAAMKIYQVNADKTISNKAEVADRIIEGAVQKVGGAIGMYADATKNPYPGPLNLNSITTPVMLAMFATGVDQMAAIMYQSLSPVKNLIQDFNKTSGSAYSQSFFSRPVSFSTFLKRKLFELEKQVSKENPKYSDAYGIYPDKEGVYITEDSYKLVWLGKDSIKKDTEEQIASRNIPIENNGWAVVDAKTNERLPKNLEDLIILKKFADYTKIANDISFKITKSTDMLKSLAPDQDRLDRLIFTVDDLMNNPSSTVFTDESINDLFKKNPVLGESLKALKSLNAVSKDVLIERTAFMKGFISLFENMWAYQRSGDKKSEVRKDIKAFLGLQFQKLALLQNPNTMESSTYLEQLDAENFLSAETVNSYYFLKDKFPNNAFLNNLTPIEHGSSAKKATLLELTSSVNEKLKDDMKNDIVFLLTHDDAEVRKNAYRIAYHGMIKSGAQSGRGSYYDILPAFLSKPMSDLMTKFRTELTKLDEIVSKDSAYESKRVKGKRKLKDSAIKKYNEGINKLFETTFGGADLSNILTEGIVKILSDKIKTTDYTYSMTSALGLGMDMSRMYEIVSNISPSNVNNIFEVLHFENGKTDYYAKTLELPTAEGVSLNKEDKIELFTPVGKTVEFNLTSVGNSGIEGSINTLLYNNGIRYHDNGNYSFPLYKINIYNQLLVLKQIDGESIGKNFANTLTENDLENLQGSVTLRGKKAIYEVVAREGSDKISALAFSHENGSTIKNYMENWQQTYSIKTDPLPIAFEQGLNLTMGRVFGMSPARVTKVDHRNKVYLLPNGELLKVGNRFVRYEFTDGKLKPFENGIISRNAIEGDNLNLFARILKEDSWESLTNNPNFQEFLKGEKFIFVYDLQNENKPPQPVAPKRVEVKEETSQDTNDIYNKLDKKTQSENVILPKDVDVEADGIGMTYTTAIEFWRKIVPEAMTLYNKSKPLIVAFRGNSKKTFLENYKSGTHTIGNPFDFANEVGTRDEQGIKSTKKFMEWMITGNNFGNPNATEEYRQTIISDIKSGKIKKSPILYYQEKGYATHATALDYLINKYDWGQPSTQPTEVKGINISTKSSDKLGRELTNPNWGAKYIMDIEAEYKANASKIKAPELNMDEALKYDMNLMYKLQMKKFKAHPELVQEITNRGGVKFLEASEHTVGVKGSRWEGKGTDSNFIKVLIKSYQDSLKATAPTTQPTESTGFQGYKGGFENTGKGTPQGDGKDNAMRQVADGFIGEINDKLELPQKTPYDLKSATSKTSTGTSFKTIGIKTKGYSQDYYNEGPTVSSGKLVTTDDMAKVVMLARNKEFSGKPLADTTKESILNAHKEGVQFVVGDMPGVDTQFIDYLQEIGANFTIYHTGNASRIQVKQPTTQPSTGVKVVSEPYGVVTVETNPSAEKTQEFVKLIQPQIKAQAYKENASIYANDMFMYGLRWTRKLKAFKPLINKSYANKGKLTIDPQARDGYVYDTVDQNGKPLPPVSDLQPIINEIEKALGRDMSDYDAVIGNIYLPGQNIAIHRDTTESESARNYPVIVYTIGNNSGIGIYENEKQPGAMSFAVDKKTVIPTKDGTIYTFGMDGKGRFELAHDTPKDIKRDQKFPPITLPDGRVITNYTITLTFRRAADLKPGMPTSPAKITAKPTSIEPTRTEDTGYKYYGATYTIILENGVGVDVKDYKGKPAAKQKILDAYNTNPDIDIQNGKYFRNFPKDIKDKGPITSSPDANKKSILDLRNNKIEYTEGQRKALLDIEKLIDSERDSIYLLAGYAGTGKTTIAENIAKYAVQQKKEILILAPTNKAANVLASKLKDAGVDNLSTKTIHSAIYGEPDPKTGEFIIGSKDPIEDAVIIVDESSMIEKQLMNDLLNEATEKGTGNNFIFMGDGFQLEQIGESSNLFESKNNTSLFEKTYGVKLDGVTELTEVKRQSLDSNILKVATLVRSDNRSYIPASSLDDFKVTTNKAEFVEDFKKSIKNNEDSVMIVATNSERLGMNNIARTVKFGADKKVIEENDNLISVANSTEYKNSELFKISKISPNSIERTDITVRDKKGKSETFEAYLVDVLTEDRKPVTLFHVPFLNVPSLYHASLLSYAKENPEFYNALEKRGLIFLDKRDRMVISKSVVISTFGYSITAHKSQGSQWEKVFVNQNYVADTWNPARWYYTAITRSSKDVIALNSGKNEVISLQKMADRLNEIITPDVQKVGSSPTEINNETINEQQQKLRDEIAKIKQEKKDDSNECNK